MFRCSFLLSIVFFFLAHANTPHLERYYEEVVDSSAISVNFTGMSLCTKLKGAGCNGSRPKDTDIQVLAINSEDHSHAMTSKMLTETFAPGVFISYQQHLNPDISLHVEFQGFLNWSKQEYARAKGCGGSHIEIPFGPLTYCVSTSDWNSGGFAYFRHESSLNSISAGIYSHASPVFLDYFTLSEIVGLRYIDFTEELKIKVHTPTALSCYFVETKNNLIGVQMGGRFLYSSSRYYALSLDLKGGVFVNVIRAHPKLFDHNNTITLFNQKVNEKVLSYVAEFHPYIIYNISDNFFVETAFDALVLWNVSLATKFVTFTRDQSDIFTRSYRYYNAFQFGVGFRF